MQKFRFRLQKILDLAKKRAEAARREAGQALLAATRAEEAVEMERAVRAAADEELSERLLLGIVEPQEILRRHAHARLLDQRIGQAEHRAEEARQAYQRARSEADARRKEEILLERARENRLDVWREDAKKSELEFMEETASVRWLRATVGADRASALKRSKES